ncbi:MAG TPA: alpha/beta fold hydrolase [Terriglobales bacterium]|nr:alpha/beta fold hydrolase [Terriglobales bacterium]
MKWSLRFIAFLLLASTAVGWAEEPPKPAEGDYRVSNFHFRSGATLPELRLHYLTYGRPAIDAKGHISNAVMILHGTTGSSRQFLTPQFAGVLFGPGQLLDASRYFIILPDGIGHGESSKPSNGLHARFPHYDYDDMVEAQHLLLTQALKVDHLRLLLGTSMGCMHSWIWLETYPDFMDAAMPLACLPVQIAGRNRMMRKMIMDAIRNDPSWSNGEYQEPPAGLKTVAEIFLIMAGSPLALQKNYPTREQADAFLEQFLKTRTVSWDANDILYAFDASRNYDPSPKLDRIGVPVMFVNSADDVINPPELGIAEREIKKVKQGRFVLLPITDETRGHGTHSLPAVWKQYLAELLQESQH